MKQHWILPMVILLNGLTSSGQNKAIYVDTNGNTAIGGTTYQQTKLSVAGQILSTGSGNSISTPVPMQGAYIDWNRELTGKTYFINNRGLGPGGFQFYNADSNGNLGNSIFTITGNGNVGIGLTNPGQKLTVSPNAAMGFTMGGLPNPVMSVGAYGANPSDGIGLFVHDTATAYQGWIGAIRSGNENCGSWGCKTLRLQVPDGSGNVINALNVLGGSGNVGIGTTNPGAKLDVPGNVYSQFGGLRLNGLDASVNQIFQSNLNTDLGITANGGDISFGQTSGQQVIIKSTGNVGIGTTGPLGVLDVLGSGAGTSNWVYLRGNTGISTPSSSAISGLKYGWNPSGGQGESQILYGIGSGWGPCLEFGRWDGTTKTIDMILNGGNVSISNGCLISTNSTGNAIQANSSGGYYATLAATNNYSDPQYITGVLSLVATGSDYGFGTNGIYGNTAGSSIFTTFKGSKGTTMLTSPLSTKVEIQFSGQGKLSKGKQEVVFDNNMSELIAEQPYKVLLTPTAACNGLAVMKKTDNGFTIHELGNGASDATFDWFLVADKAVSAIDQSVHPMPKTEPKVMQSVQKIPSKK